MQGMKDTREGNTKKEVNIQNQHHAAINNSSNLDDVVFLLAK